METLNLLQSLGLSKTEAELYLANLELGPSSAIQLGQQLGFTRQLMYNLLPGLIERGYVKQLTIGKRHYFQAVEPEVLQDKARELLKDITSALPDLKKQQAKNTAVPAITVYDSPLSMREWYRQLMRTMKKGEEKLVYSTETGWYGIDTEFYQKYAERQTKVGLKNRIIAPDSQGAHAVADKITSATHQYRFAPEGWLGENSKWIWRNQIVHLTVRGKYTNMIIIESEELANLERFAFNRVWDSLGQG